MNQSYFRTSFIKLIYTTSIIKLFYNKNLFHIKYVLVLATFKNIYAI